LQFPTEIVWVLNCQNANSKITYNWIQSSFKFDACK